MMNSFPLQTVAVALAVALSILAVPKVSSAAAPLRWWCDELTVVFDASLDEVGPGGRDAAKLAFGTWVGSGARLPRLAFEDAAGLGVNLEPDGVSSVLNAPIDVPGQAQALAISISHVSAETGAIVEVDVVVNSQSPFGVVGDPEHACGERYDLQNVLTHEAGHFFGLDEDASDSTATMFYKTAKCELQKRDLNGSDRSGMTELYARDPEREQADAGVGCSGARVARAPAGGAAWITALLFAMGVARSRRLRPR